MLLKVNQNYLRIAVKLCSPCVIEHSVVVAGCFTFHHQALCKAHYFGNLSTLVGCTIAFGIIHIQLNCTDELYIAKLYIKSVVYIYILKNFILNCGSPLLTYNIYLAILDCSVFNF